jgi:hypothetical protein
MRVAAALLDGRSRVVMLNLFQHLARCPQCQETPNFGTLPLGNPGAF